MDFEDLLDGINLLAINRFFHVFVLIVLTFVTLKIIKKWVNHLLENDAIKQKRRTLIPVLYQIIRAVVIFMVACVVLSLFGISTTPLVAISSSVGLVIGIGSQQTIKDFLSGFFILSEDQFNVGDRVTIANEQGIVIEVGLRTTHLRSFTTGEVVIIPNSLITIVKNASSEFLVARVEVVVLNAIAATPLLAAIKEELKELYNPREMFEVPRLLGISRIDAASYTIVVECHVKGKHINHVENTLTTKLREIIENQSANS